MLLSVILMSGRPDWMIFNVCVCFSVVWWGRGVDVIEVGVNVRMWGDGVVSQRGWQTGGLWERVTEAIRGLHGLTWGPFMGLSNCWPAVTQGTGSALAHEWRDHVNEEDGAWNKRQGWGWVMGRWEDEQDGGIVDELDMRWDSEMTMMFVPIWMTEE